jgi:hypothetical protein
MRYHLNYTNGFQSIKILHKMAAGSKFEVRKISGGRKGPILVKKTKVSPSFDGLS